MNNTKLNFSQIKEIDIQLKEEIKLEEQSIFNINSYNIIRLDRKGLNKNSNLKLKIDILQSIKKFFTQPFIICR